MLRVIYSKPVLIVLSLVVSLLICEILCGYVLKFPKYGVEKQIFGTQQFKKSHRIFKPYSTYMAREIGYKVYGRNNIGLTGNDINITDNSYKNIFVVGSSYVEALQVKPDSIASSILNSHYKNINLKYQVINCGAGGHDIYDSYFRILYYSDLFRPFKIIYVLDGTWMNQHSSMNFKPDIDFGKPDNDFLLMFHNAIRNNSSLLNLIAEYSKETFKVGNKGNLDFNTNPESDDPGVIDSIKKCVSQYSKVYGNDFILISLENQKKNIGDSLRVFCEENRINFLCDTTIMVNENILKGKGHFNNRGNYLLAQKLIFASEEFIEKYNQ